MVRKNSKKILEKSVTLQSLEYSLNMRLSKPLIVCAFFVALLSSCVTPKEVNYLSDLNPNQNFPLNSKFEAVISPYDQLRITVIGMGAEKELAEPFNPFGTAQNVGNQNGSGYLVDVNGVIQFPIFGQLYVQGMTRIQLQEYIRKRLVAEGHMHDPMVDVRFSNFRVFILGTGDGGKVLNIENERCTFLEALAMAGGLDQFTPRDRIAVMREINGEMVTHYLDPRSKEVFNDPFFMLQQNDVIITQTLGRKYVMDVFNATVNVVSVVASLASTVVMIYLLTTGKQ